MELNEKTIVSLSDLLKTDKETVTKALTESEADSSFIDSFKESNIIKPKDEYYAFLKNYPEEIKQKHIQELKEKAKSKELPQELYSFFKGNVAEELEKKLSRAANVNEYENFDDLVNKVISSKGTDEAMKQQFKELQEINKQLQEKAEKAPIEAESKYNEKLIDLNKKSIFDSLKLDYEEKAIAKQLQLLINTVDANYNYIIRDGKNIVTDKEGNVLKNESTLEPLTFEEVVLTVAKDYDFKIKSPESGGLGGSSSQNLNPATGLSWEEYLQGKNVEPYTKEADKLRVEWKKANK